MFPVIVYDFVLFCTLGICFEMSQQRTRGLKLKFWGLVVHQLFTECCGFTVTDLSLCWSWGRKLRPLFAGFISLVHFERIWNCFYSNDGAYIHVEYNIYFAAFVYSFLDLTCGLLSNSDWLFTSIQPNNSAVITFCGFCWPQVKEINIYFNVQTSTKAM